MIAIVVLAICDVVADLLSQISYVYTATLYHDVRTRLSCAVLRKAQRLPLATLRVEYAGTLLSRTTSDPDALANVICYVLLPLGQSLIQLVAALIFMFSANAVLAISSLVFVPIWIALVSPRDTRTDDLRERIMKTGDELKQIVMECLSYTGLFRVKSFVAFEFDAGRFELVSVLLKTLNLRWVRTMALKSFGLSATSNVFGQVVTLAVGAWLIFGGKMSVGTLIAFLVLQARLYGPIQTLAYTRINLATNRPIIERVRELFAREEERDGTVPAAGGDLVASDLQFTAGDRLLFENVTFDVAPGDWVSITGENGCGKSVLMQLLPRLLDGRRGDIELGGVPIDRVRLTELRSRVLVLPPHDTLFTGTVRDNIAYGPAIPDESIWSVLDMVEIGDRIRSYPKGLGAEIKPLGTELSSGERQRLALARAILREPDVLVIDEATSSIDAEAEQRILARLRSRRRQSLIFISHRETPHLFDRAYRLESRGLIAAVSAGSSPSMGLL